MKIYLLLSTFALFGLDLSPRACVSLRSGNVLPAQALGAAFNPAQIYRNQATERLYEPASRFSILAAQAAFNPAQIYRNQATERLYEPASRFSPPTPPSTYIEPNNTQTFQTRTLDLVGIEPTTPCVSCQRTN